VGDLFVTIPTTAISRIVMSEHVCPLSKRDFGYLQVVLSEFELHREEHGRHLRVHLPDDPPTIVGREGKREIESQSRAEDSRAPRVRRGWSIWSNSSARSKPIRAC
jgi:hypothetical protein